MGEGWQDWDQQKPQCDSPWGHGHQIAPVGPGPTHLPALPLFTHSCVLWPFPDLGAMRRGLWKPVIW